MMPPAFLILSVKTFSVINDRVLTLDVTVTFAINI